MKKREDYELLAPAGSYESLTAAGQGGADAIYFGVEQLNMRARSSSGFTLEDLPRMLERAGELGLKAYLTVNTVIYNQELIHRTLNCRHSGLGSYAGCFNACTIPLDKGKYSLKIIHTGVCNTAVTPC